MASQENEKAMDGLLRRSLARDGAAKGECLSTELLAAYYDHSLGATEAAEYELHFSQCTLCREQLAMMARAEAEHKAEFALEPVLRAALTPVELAVAASRGPAVPSQTRPPAEMKQRPSRLLDLRWLVPVAAVLVLSTFILMRFASRGTSVELNKEVAISTPTSTPSDEQDQHTSNNSVASESNPRATKDEQNLPSGSTGATEDKKSKPMQARRTEPSNSAGRAASKSAHAATSGGTVLKPMMQGVIIHPDSKKSIEAPAAPLPELNTALPSIPVAADSAVSVQPSAPPAPAAQQNPRPKFAINGLGASTRSGHGAVSKNAPAKSKSASERSAALVIPTPASTVLYRTAGGGMVERSDDDGVTWQGQLLNSSAEFTAGSCPATNICWLVGRAGVVFLTADGKNWKNVSAPSSIDLAGIDAKDALSATVTANDGRKWSSEDGGETWSPAN